MHVSHCDGTLPSSAQAEVLALGILQAGFDCILQMPTGSGKTYLAEEAISSALGNGLRAVYLSPLRALASERLPQWQKRFAPFKVGIFTGDYGGTTGKAYPVAFRDARVLIMTPERLDACTRNWRTHWAWLPEVEVVLVDELHVLGEKRRGARLEGTLTRIKRLNPFLSLIGLSATLGNREELAEWLGGVAYHSDSRPIPLEWRIVRYRQPGEKPNLLLNEVARTIASGGKSLVFVQSRRRCEQLSSHLQAHGLRAHHHHAGLSLHERRTIEENFRGAQLDCLVATATLEMGLNLPVRQVIVYDVQEFDGIDYRPLSTISVWQRVGRAGRPGLDNRGEAVLFASTWDRDVRWYEQGRFEPIRSGLADKRALAEQAVTEVASGFASTSAQLRRIFAQSLAAHQQILPDVDATISQMCGVGMLNEQRTEGSEGEPGRVPRLQATRLGRIATRHFLSPETLLLFKRVLECVQSLTFLDLLMLASSSDECEPVLPVDFEELRTLGSRLEHEPSMLLQQPPKQVVLLLGVRGKRLLSSIKMALLLRAWTRSADASVAARDYRCYPFELERLCASLERLLLAMTATADDQAITSVLLGRAVSAGERIQILRQMVIAGLDEYAAALTLVDGIGPKWAARLQESGIRDLVDLARAEPGEICRVPGISMTRAQRWIDHAHVFASHASAFRYKEDAPSARLASSDWPEGIDIYRLRRALELSVAPADEKRYIVTGGLEPHTVRNVAGTLLCDCLDAEKGFQCKHLLAIQMQQGDRALREMANRLQVSPDTRLDLLHLWFDGGSRSPL